ncbi:M48 family metalloprotease [bacterium]|nr:M48 family metalloprotease [bacterium]
MEYSVAGTIRYNELKLAVFISIISLLIMILGWIISDIYNLGMIGVFVSFLIAAGANFFSYFFSKSIVLKSHHAIPMTPNEYPEYCKMVQDMCARNNMIMPELYYINTPALNAFATGRSQKDAAVVVTSGLLRGVPLDEISGVIGHELSHILHKDILVTTFIATMLGYVSILATSLRNIYMYRGSSGRNQNIGLMFLIGMVLSIAVPFVSMLIKMAVSRSREYMADATGGQLCGNPQLLAKALYRISHDGNPMQMANAATEPLYIANPFKGSFFAKLMSTHPDTNDRIRRLQNMRFYE